MDLPSLCSQHNITPRRLIEVGAAHPNSQRLTHFIKGGFDVVLIEANPRLFYCLTKGSDYADDFETTWPNIKPPPYGEPGLGAYTNCVIHNVAIVDKDRIGTVIIYDRKASSCVAGITSPAKANDGFVEGDGTPGYEVRATTIDEFDNGQVDILLADVEGCEWYCIKNLISRPKIIVLETHGKGYTNPHLSEINEWMAANSYEVVGSDDTDTTYVKSA